MALHWGHGSPVVKGVCLFSPLSNFHPTVAFHRAGWTSLSPPPQKSKSRFCPMLLESSGLVLLKGLQIYLSLIRHGDYSGRLRTSSNFESSGDQPGNLMFVYI